MADDIGLTEEELQAEPQGGHKFSGLGKGEPLPEEQARKLAKESAIVGGIADKEYIDQVTHQLTTTGESPTADSRQAVVFEDDLMGDFLNPEDNLLSEVATTTNTASESAITEQAREVFMLRRLQNPEEDINSLWNRTEADIRNSGDIRSLVDEERIRFGDNEYTQALNMAMEAVKQGDQEAFGFAQELIENPTIYSEHYADGNETITAIASTAPASFENFKIREEASKQEMYKVLSEWSEDRGILDKVVDFGALLLVPDTTVDLDDLMDAGIIGSIPEFYADLKRFHYELSPEQRTEQFKVIFPKIVEAFDNNEFKIAAITSMFMDKDLGQARTDIGLTLAGEALIAFDVFAALKAVSNIRKARNMAHTYKKAGRIDEAARATIAASADDGSGQVEKVVGMNKGEAAASTSPVEYESVIPNSIDGIAARVQEVKEQALKTIEEDLVGWSANKMPRVEEKVLRSQKRDLQRELAVAKKDLEAFPETAGGTRKSREKVAQARQAIKAGMKDIEDRLKLVDDQLNLNNRYATAEAELSRIQQGVYSPAVKARLDEAVEAELNKMRAEAQARGTGEVPEAAQKPSEAPVARTESPETTGIGSVMDDLTDEFKDELEGAVFGPMRQAVTNLIKPVVLDEKARAAAVRRAEEKIQAEVQAQGNTFANARVTQMDNDGFKMEYEVDGTGEVYEHKWVRNDAGSWVSENTDPDSIRKWVNSGLGKNIFSPQVLLERLNAGIVDTVTFSGQQSAAIRNTLGKVWKDAEDGLSSKDIELVDNLLFAGDEWVENGKIGKVFTPAELRHGIELKTGTVALDGMENSQDIMRSYYRKRAFYDELHRIRDMMTRRNLEVKGFKNLDYVQDGTLKQAVVRPLERWEFPDMDDLDYVLDMSTGKLNKESLHQVSYLKFKGDEFKAAEYQVVELFEPVKVGKTKITHGIVRQTGPTKIGGLPSRVLNYSPGYLPRVYQKGMYFVKNQAGENNETLYAFKSRKEADDYVNQIKREQDEFIGPLPQGQQKIDPVIREDRQLNQNELLLEQNVGFGGMYTGSRKRTPLMVKEGENTFRPDRISTAQSTERYLINMAEAMPLNEFKEFAMQEWVNTVNKLAGMTNSGKGVRSFSDPIDIDSRYAVVLEQARDYLKKSFNIPTQEERHTHGWMMGISNMMEGKPFLAKPRQWFIDHADTDITRQLKAYTFDLTMGWFNARQLFVQAQNASLAASMFPQHAGPAFLDMMKMRSILHMPEHQLREAAKTLKYDEDFVDSVIKFKQSGLEDAIVRTADFNPVKAGVAQSSRRAISKAAKHGRFFYEEGELASRLMTWSIARRRLGKNASAEELSKETVRMHMNLQSENAAWWQNAPVIGMATQFLQVQAKFIENVMPKIMGGSGKWTGREKAFALAGQLTLYGTSGVFIAEEFSAFMAEQQGMSIDQWERENPGVAEFVQEGFVGSTLALFGAKDINATEAVSLIAGLDDNVVADLIKATIAINQGGYKDALDVTDVTFGPALSTIKRGGDALASMVDTAKMLTSVPDDATFVALLMNNISQVASMTSTWNNVKKMKVLQQAEVLLGSQGQKIADASDLGDLNPLEHLFIAMGFSTDAEVAHYRQKDFIQDVQKDRAGLRKDLLQNYKEYAKHQNEELYLLKRALILRSTDLSDVEKINVDSKIVDEIMGPSSIDVQVKQFMTELIKSQGRLKTAPGMSQLIEGEKIDD